MSTLLATFVPRSGPDISVVESADFYDVRQPLGRFADPDIYVAFSYSSLHDAFACAVELAGDLCTLRFPD